MSNSANAILATIPHLSGPNYSVWAPIMEAYLSSQGQWRILFRTAPHPEYPTHTIVKQDEKGKDVTVTKPDTSADPINEEAIEKWEDINSRARGNINLRLHSAIVYKYKGIYDAGILWNTLKAEFGQPGIAATYKEFKAAIDLTIPENSDPSLAVNKLIGHFARMEEAKCPFPEHLRCLILLTKFPSNMHALAQLITQKDDLSKLRMDEIARMVTLAWEQSSNNKKGGSFGQAQAKKISAVKRQGGNPSFKQQLQDDAPSPSTSAQPQERGEGNQRGRGGNQGRNRRPRGNRAGKQVQQAEEEQQGEQENFEFQIACPTTMLPPPSSLPPPRPAPRHFVASRPLLATPREFAHRTPTSVYPTFNKAHSLAQRLGVAPTSGTVQRLEVSEIARSSDPRPRKRQRVNPEEEVSLFCPSEEEDVDMFLDDAAGPSGTTQRFVLLHPTPSLQDVENDAATNKQVVTNSPPSWTSSLQNGRREEYCTPVDLVARNKETCFPLNNETQGQIEWMIDSGASNHFTFDKNDFVEYETITRPIQVQAATATTKVAGKGTIILIANGSAYRIGPVYHVPELNCRLLSLGQFHRSGLYSRGSAREIKLYNEYSGLEFLSFYPRHDKGTTYIIKALLGNFEEQKTIHNVDFEIMHRRLAHPSREVQRKAEKNVKDYPKGVLIPDEPHVEQADLF